MSNGEGMELGALPLKSKRRVLLESASSATIGTIPLAGPALQQVFALVVGFQFQERTEEWLKQVVEAITELQQQGRAPEWAALTQDEQFLDVLISATRAAQGTSRQEKLRALRSAVMNSSCGNSPGEDLERRFIEIVDRCVPSHLRLLQHMRNPKRALKIAGIRWAEATDRFEERTPWGSHSEPPLPIWLDHMRAELYQELLEVFGESNNVTARLIRDLESWQLLGAPVSLTLHSGYLSSLGEELLNYVDITEATAEAFEAFGDGNR